MGNDLVNLNIALFLCICCPSMETLRAGPSRTRVTGLPRRPRSSPCLCRGWRRRALPSLPRPTTGTVTRPLRTGPSRRSTHGHRRALYSPGHRRIRLMVTGFGVFIWEAALVNKCYGFIQYICFMVCLSLMLALL